MAKLVLDQVQLSQALWLCGPISVRRTAGTYGVASLVSRNPVILKLMPMHLYPTGETSDACSRSLLRTESYWIQWTSFSCDQAMCLCSPNHLAMVPCPARNTRPWKRCLEPSRGSTWHVHWLALAPCCLALRTSGLSAGPAGTGTWKDGKDGRFGRSSEDVKGEHGTLLNQVAWISGICRFVDQPISANIATLLGISLRFLFSCYAA